MAPKHKAHVSAKEDKQSKKLSKMKSPLDASSWNGIDEKIEKKDLGKNFDNQNNEFCGFSIVKMKTSSPEQMSKDDNNDSLDYPIVELNQLLQENQAHYSGLNQLENLSVPFCSQCEIIYQEWDAILWSQPCG